jgi:hypothetical protein
MSPGPQFRDESRSVVAITRPIRSLLRTSPLLRRLIPVVTSGIVVMPDRAASSSSRQLS